MILQSRLRDIEKVPNARENSTRINPCCKKKFIRFLETQKIATPSRIIGEVLAHSEGKAEDSGTPWRNNKSQQPPQTQQPPSQPPNPPQIHNQPELKVVNVAVENNANIHFSESAESLMANHMKQQQTTR